MFKAIGIKNISISPWLVGIIAIIILIIAIFNFGKWQMNRKINQEIQLLMEGIENQESRPITQEDLKNLPKPVQRWLDRAGVIGKEPIQSLYFKQRGKMKLEPDQEKWLEPKAEQYIRVEEPAYLWHVDLPMIPLINTKGRDLYYEGEGQMNIKVGSLIPVVNAKPNEKINESSLHRFLLEIPWYPTAALSPYITWEGIDDYTAEVTMEYKGSTGSAIFYFDEEGDLIKNQAMRFKETDEDGVRLECIGEVRGYDIIDGLRLPTEFDVSWMLEEGKFTWYKIEIYDIHLN